MIRTSLTHPIRVDALPVAGGLLGLTFCPGKHGDSLNGAQWARDLETDLAALKAWGAGLVVTLMERHEFASLRVPDLDLRVRAYGMTWVHLPIPDQGVPGGAFSVAWPNVREELLSHLTSGGRVVLHCRGGLGRTGLVAAVLLIEAGMAQDDAIRAVRSVRPRAIETVEQVCFVRDWPARKGPAAGLTT
jgi:ADP-ribosyl-[dinitrogen reductase] hydrolase